MTQVIVDSGTSWRVIARIDDLAGQIDPGDDATIDTAIISGISDDGILKVISAVNPRNGGASAPPTCQGQQYFRVDSGKAVADSEHQMVCDQAAN